MSAQGGRGVCPGGGCLPRDRGVSAQGERGVYPRGCLPRGVSDRDTYENITFPQLLRADDKK